MMPLETGKGSFFVGSGQSEGDWVVLNDSQGRVLVYSLAKGELRHRFFGRHASINPNRRQLIVENTPGELKLYDLATGQPVATYIVRGKAVFLRFNLQGTRLFVLNDGQTAYSFDVGKIIPAATKPITF